MSTVPVKTSETPPGYTVPFVEIARTLPGEGDGLLSHLRRTEANYRSMLETAPCGIFRSTDGGRFLMVNPALTKMLGYDCEQELLSLTLEYDVYCNPHQRVLLMRECMETRYLKEAEANWRRKDGRTITVL
jgi:PAS domain S-box-containing protein